MIGWRGFSMIWAMKIYAERPGALLRQLAADLLVVAWVAVGVWIIDFVRDSASRLGAPGRSMESTGADLGDRFADAGEQARKVPGVGRSLAAPFEAGVDAADAMSRAGQSYQEAIDGGATLLTVLVAVITVLGVLAFWLPPRARWARRATAAARLRADPAGQDLLALRALASRPLRVLRAVGPDPAGGWRRGDPETVAALVALELRAAGLRLRPDAARRP